MTEDADLGIRLARFGYVTATIVSRTYEEAPVTFRQWLPQRRRWIKGWMQTVALLPRAGHLARSRGCRLRQRLAVHGVLSAGVLGLLLYPASLLVIADGDPYRRSRGSWPSDPLIRSPARAECRAIFLRVLLAAVVASLRGLAATRRAAPRSGTSRCCRSTGR